MSDPIVAKHAEMSLQNAMRAFLADWSADLSPDWRALTLGHGPDVTAIDPTLALEVWEPIFPVRRGKHFPGMPHGTHCFRAFDDIAPEQVRCLILGQDPYPEPAIATGRAFEAGNVADWRELDKMFTKSIRAFMQLIVAARAGDASYAQSFADWPKTLSVLQEGWLPPAKVADHWVSEGVLLLNAALTLTRFQVQIDPHQSAGHLRLWQPFMRQIVRALADRDTPLVLIGFGDAAAQILADAGINEGVHGHLYCTLREHPAQADAVLARPNPFVLCNDFLKNMGVCPIKW